MEKLLRFLRGYLLIRIWGFSPERFINLCAVRKIFLWEVRRNGQYYEMCMDLKSFFLLPPIVRKTGVKVVILERRGLPFFMPKIKKRWVFLLGVMLAAVFWWASSHFVWKIELYGNTEVTDDQLLTFLEEQDIRIGTLWKKLDITALEKEIRRQYPVVTWTSVKLVGTRLEVWIKENETILIPQEAVGESGSEIISPAPGRILSMVVRKGVPKVGIGDEVTGEQVLVEGRVPVYNEDQTVREYLYVDADADIVLEYSLLYEGTLPEEHICNVYSGRSRREYFVRMGEACLSIPGQESFYRETQIQRNYAPDWMEILKLPLCFGEMEYWEYLPVRKKYTGEEAKCLLEEKLLRFLATLEEKGVQIMEKDVRIDKEGDCWLIYGNLTLQENVGKNRRLQEGMTE